MLESTTVFEVQSEVDELFLELQLELVHCELCGDYHPPDLHAGPIIPLDAIDPEEA